MEGAKESLHVGLLLASLSSSVINRRFKSHLHPHPIVSLTNITLSREKIEQRSLPR